MEEPTNPQFSKVILAGDLADFECPLNSSPEVDVGTFIPHPESPSFYVIEVKGNAFKLAPLKTGTLELDYSCSDGTKIKGSIEVPSPDPQNLPPKSGPLGLLEFNLLLFWLMIFLLLTSVLGVLVFRAIKKKKIVEQTKQKEALLKAHKKTPKQLLAETILTFEQMQKDLNSPKGEMIYQKGYRTIRGYLETELKLKTQHETTPQFLGSLRIKSPKFGISADTLDDLEKLLVTADNNRFGSGVTDELESRKQFVSLLIPTLKKLAKITLPDQATSSTSKRMKS